MNLSAVKYKYKHKNTITEHNDKWCTIWYCTKKAWAGYRIIIYLYLVVLATCVCTFTSHICTCASHNCTWNCICIRFTDVVLSCTRRVYKGAVQTMLALFFTNCDCICIFVVFISIFLHSEVSMGTALAHPACANHRVMDGYLPLKTQSMRCIISRLEYLCSNRIHVWILCLYL